MTGERCAICLFYKVEAANLGTEGLGFCRRFPPQMVPYPTDNQHPITYWPSALTTRVAGIDWCGEFKDEGYDERVLGAGDETMNDLVAALRSYRVHTNTDSGVREMIWHMGKAADHIDTQSATIARLEAENAQMRELVKACAERFREYETSHATKGNIDGDVKARRNAKMAELCEAALSFPAREVKG